MTRLGEAMTRRRAATLVEVAVALVLATLLAAVGWGLLGTSTAGEKSTDRSARRTLEQAALYELLLRDLRSSVEVGHVGDRDLRIRGYRLDAGKLALREARWMQDGKGRVRRTAEGEPDRVYDFSEVLAPGSPVFEVRVEGVDDVLFLP